MTDGAKQTGAAPRGTAQRMDGGKGDGSLPIKAMNVRRLCSCIRTQYYLTAIASLLLRNTMGCTSSRGFQVWATMSSLHCPNRSTDTVGIVTLVRREDRQDESKFVTYIEIMRSSQVSSLC